MFAARARLLPLLLILPLAAACGDGLLDTGGITDGAPAVSARHEADSQARPEARAAALVEAELAFPDEIGAISEAYYAGRKIEVEEIDGALVLEGDILLHPDQVSFEPVDLVLEPGEAPESLTDYHRLTARTQNFWPDGVVYYAVDPALPNQQRVTDAIAHWEANTTLTFQPRTSQSDYVYFTPGNGCSSYIGRIGGRQEIALTTACSTGNTIHEIGHAIGLWHEQSRTDRYSSIVINWENIQEGREHNFQTYDEQGYDGGTFNAELDFGSIMMYGSYSFSKNGQPTIVKTDGSTFNIQRNGLSPDDLAGIARLYPADGGEPEYLNGEYYTLAGLRVYRMYNRWYYYHSEYGWKEVRLSSSGNWYYA